MNNNFWKKLPIPFFCLAPMLDVTDSPFRQIVSKCGKPDVFWTWFVSTDGLCSEGKRKILSAPNLHIAKSERPIVAQLFGKDPEKFYQSAKILAKLGFDGIDINFGCPDKDILKQGSGGELIRNPKLAREIIKSAKKGAGKIPVSVKTRIGYHKNEIEKWIPELIKENPAAICIHGRTCKQKYGGEANWNAVKKAVEIAKGSGILIIGNGDIKNREEGLSKARECGLDGIMVGRAILNNPWIFRKTETEISKREKIKMLIKHAKLFEKYYQGRSFSIFRKYFHCYISGFFGSREERAALMKAKNVEDIEIITRNFIK